MPSLTLEEAAEKTRNNGVSTDGIQYISPRWDISQERAFMETLLGQRTGFLLVFFGLVIAGAVNTRALPVAQFSILVFGCFITFALTLAIGRAQKKLDIIINIIKLDPDHPLTVVDNIAGPLDSKRRIVGYGVPWACVFVLVSASLASWYGYFSASTPNEAKSSITIPSKDGG